MERLQMLKRIKKLDEDTYYKIMQDYINDNIILTDTQIEKILSKIESEN